MKKISNFLALLMTVSILLMGCIGLAACAPTVEELTIQSMPAKTSYLIGEKFFPKGLTLKAVWSDGTEEDVDYSQCSYPTTAFTEIVDKVTVTYENASVDVPVTVYEEVVVESIMATGDFVSAVKTTDKLTLKDLMLTAVYNDGTMQPIDEYTVSIDGTDVTAQVIGKGVEGISLTKGLHKCELIAEGKSYTYYIGAYDETAEQIKVEAENLKYTADLTGSESNFLEVVALGTDRTGGAQFTAEETADYGASGTGSIGAIQKGDTFKLRVTVAEAGTYNFYSNVSSTSRASKTSMASNVVNSLFKMKVNGTDFAIPDAAVAHGHTSTKWATIDWFYWTLVCFGGVELQAGENVIEIECYNTNNIYGGTGECMNFDYFTFQKQ